MQENIQSIEIAVQSIQDEFNLFDDWIQRYEYIVELGEALTGLPEDKKIDQNKVKGCQSQVWFVPSKKDQRLYFEADSDAMIVRGLISLLLRVYSGRTPQEIMNTPANFFDAIDLGSHLSGNRANGLASMVQHIRSFARLSE